MPTYRFPASPAYDAGTNQLYPGATFTFKGPDGNPAPITDISGATITSVTANGVGIIPGFLSTTVSTGFLDNGAGVQLDIISSWAQDPAKVAAQVASDAAAAAASATSAATSASTATGGTAGIAAGLAQVQGDVANLSTAQTNLAATVAALPAAGGVPFAGGQTQVAVRAAGSTFTAPARRTGSSAFLVEFIGSAAALATLSLVGAGVATGYQEGDKLSAVG